MTLSQGTAKDRILKYAVEQNGFVTASKISEEVFNGGINKDEVVHLIRRISDEIIDVKYGEWDAWIHVNGLTANFLEQGGYQQLEEDEIEQVKLRKRREQIEVDLAESNLKANTLNEENSRFNKRTTIINIVVGILNLGLIIYQLLFSK